MMDRYCSIECGRNFVVKEENCDFDAVLKEKWEEAERKGVFRYTLNIRDWKVLHGKYEFLVQLNIDRGSKRRPPEDIASMRQPFDETRFNFTKLKPQEEAMNLSGDGKEEDVIAVNASPIEYCHCLLLPQRSKRLPQVVTKYSLFKAIELFFLSSSPYLRAGFNSLCAYASVNHLHWHFYYLNKKMLLERIDLKEYCGPVQILEDYPAKGFCVKYSDVRSTEEFVDLAFSVINYLQNAQVAHNVYVTRAKINTGTEEENKDLRMYIWARKPATGAKHTEAFNPAICELFGHMSVKSEEIYENLTEECVGSILRDITEETFRSVVGEVKSLLEGRLSA